MKNNVQFHQCSWPGGLLVLHFLFFWFAGYAQQNEGDQREVPSELFMNVNVGFGIPYGGLGGNFELGAGHFSSYAAFGYAPKRTLDTLAIQATFNYLLGFRYYFDVNSDLIYPRIGLSFGWITNYYSEQIGNEPYKQKVEGLSVQAGCQVYTTEGFVLNFDLAMASRYTAINQASHPYFYYFYVRPTIGIGIDIQAIGGGKKKSRTIRNKRIEPLN